MLKKVLIANRGEIACRIARTAAKMGIATVAVYSDADARAVHVAACDEAVHIGPSPATESYLRMDKIIAAAKASGADAIHPGYGFLSENPELPEACEKAGLIFIGPTAAAMRALGGKAAAKELAIKAGVPVVPGYQGDKQDAKSLAKEAARIGYPVMIKAVAGGGGRGMRQVETPAQLPEMLESAQREAQSAFGNAHVLIEKVVVRPRHIEVQVFGDSHGNVVHMFERDCTLQRRNQKVIEEAPAPGMSPGLRDRMCTAAVKLAKSVGYTGAGTVEFLVEGGILSESAPWYFIEMNTRLQVEHPVTEEITGLDLVEWQFHVAAGGKLPLAQGDIQMNGHAVEVRLCAEDPAKGFMPSVGRIDFFEEPRTGNVRTETGVTSHSEVSPFYDSMIAKLIVCRPDRATALEHLRTATLGTCIAGPKTNQTFLARLLADADVQRGDMDTGLIARRIDDLARPVDPRRALTIGLSAWLRSQSDGAATLGHNPAGFGPWREKNAFQLGPPRSQPIAVFVDDALMTLDVTWAGHDGLVIIESRGGSATGPAHGTANAAENFDGLEKRHTVPAIAERFNWPAPGVLQVIIDGAQTTLRKPSYDTSDIDDGEATGAIRAPINGRVAKLFVALGATVAKGDKIAVVEAMKMEHVIAAAIAGTVDKIAVSEGAQVSQGALLAHIAAAA